MTRKRKTKKIEEVTPVELVEGDLDQVKGAGLNFTKITYSLSDISFAKQGTELTSIKDGTSNTFFVGERNR